MVNSLVSGDSFPQERLTREFVAKVIHNRGRKVALIDYLKAYPDELLRGVLVAGSIGSGRTERAKSIVMAALDKDFGVLVFDPSVDYQSLLNLEPNGVVIDASEFYINPLEPLPGMSLEEWAPTFIQVFAQIFGLKDPSIAILQKAMNHLIENQEKQTEPPTLKDLYQEVVTFSPRG